MVAPKWVSSSLSSIRLGHPKWVLTRELGVVDPRAGDVVQVAAHQLLPEAQGHAVLLEVVDEEHIEEPL
jgi:hypothetical protein